MRGDLGDEATLSDSQAVFTLHTTRRLGAFVMIVIGMTGVLALAWPFIKGHDLRGDDRTFFFVFGACLAAFLPPGIHIMTTWRKILLSGQSADIVRGSWLGRRCKPLGLDSFSGVAITSEMTALDKDNIDGFGFALASAMTFGKGFYIRVSRPLYTITLLRHRRKGGIELFRTADPQQLSAVVENVCRLSSLPLLENGPS